MATNLKVGDKVRVGGSQKIGVVKGFEITEYGDAVTVAWPVPGKMFPILRAELARDLVHVDV